MTATSPQQRSEPDRSPAAKRTKTQHRRYGFACSNCRRKKAKCNGEYPACDKCAHNKEECSYDKGPSVAYSTSQQKRLKSYENCFEQLRHASTEGRLALLNEFLANDKLPGDQQNSSRSDAPAERGEDGRGTGDGVTRESNGRIEQPDQTSIGVDGGICFYGKTSLYYVEPQEDNEAPLARDDNEQAPTEHDPSTATAPYTGPTYFQGLEYCTVGAIRTEVSTETFNELLLAYWYLPHHFHLVLCKRLFLRDLWTGGSYVTPFLLSAVLAQAARYCNRPDGVQIGAHFASRALQLLPQDIDSGSQIPTIQGLLILSSREVAVGRLAQGWLYSGMAFRIMRDLGLHVPPKKLGYLARQFSEEDLAIRQQVFWSCYTWDKTMSLCLGRPPVILDTIEFPTPDTILDGRAEDQAIWMPIAALGDALTTRLAQRALSSVRFSAYCELATIINDVLDVLYSRPHSGRDAHLLNYLESALRRLENWSSKLPEDLFIQHDQKTVICPPLHILLLNLSYHATTVLLCRPYRNKSQRARKSCTEAARMIDVLFTLHVRRFGFKYITYLQTYTMFVACTINVLDFQENQILDDLPEEQQRNRNPLLAAEASARLDFGLEVLRQAGSTPSAARCAAIIARLLRKVGTGQSMLKNKPGEQPTLDAGHAQSSSPSQNATEARACLSVNSSDPIKDGHIQSTTPTYDPMKKSIIDSMSGQDIAPGPPIQQQSNPPVLSMAQSQGLLATLNPQGHNGSNLPQENFDYTGDQSGAGVIETPLRWLPENMQDDGSWMLMVDSDPNYALMANY